MLSSLLVSSTLLSVSRSSEPAFRCCRSHTTPLGCSLETYTKCEWLDSEDPLLDLMKGTRQCVTEGYYNCAKDVNCNPALLESELVDGCGLETCSEVEGQFNVQFIIDEASNKGLASYNYVLDFVKMMIETNIAPNARVSVLAFGEQNDWVYKFGEDQSSRDGVLAAIEAERSDYMETGNDNRCTALAFDEGAADFTGTDGIMTDDKNIMFLVTDSTPAAYGAGCGDKKMDYNMCARKASLMEAGIKLYVVGVGYFFDPSTYQCVVDPHGDDIKFVRDFDTEPFYEAVSILRETVCPVPKEERGMYNIFAQKMVALLGGDADAMSSGSDYIVAFGIVLAVIGMVLYAIKLQNGKHLANEYTPLAAPAPYGAV